MSTEPLLPNQDTKLEQGEMDTSLPSNRDDSKTMRRTTATSPPPTTTTSPGQKKSTLSTATTGEERPLWDQCWGYLEGVSFSELRLVFGVGQLVWPFVVSFVLTELVYPPIYDAGVLLIFCIGGNVTMLILLHRKAEHEQQRQQQEAESNQGGAPKKASSFKNKGDGNNKIGLKTVDFTPTICWVLFPIVLEWTSEVQAIFALGTFVVLAVAIFSCLRNGFITTIQRLFIPTFVTNLFKEMEEDYFEQLRETEHERDARLAIQQEKLSYLHERRSATRSSTSQDHTKWAYGVVVAVCCFAIFSFWFLPDLAAY